MSDLFGNYYVKPTASACVRAFRVCNGKMGDYQKIRKHALNLAFWPDDADLNWDWIKSLETKRVGELRIDERIAGHNNLRIIFFKANKLLPGDTMPRIWTLTVFQKKSQDFSGKEIAAFRAMRDIVVARWYADIPGA
ncbi:MAG: hypothetical protein ACKVP0_14140 [Pirellulaceae bacterium]